MTLSSLWIVMGLLTAAQDVAVGSVRVAVVNVAVVSEQYRRTADLEAQFEGKRHGLQQQRDALGERIEKGARSLQEELKPGTEAFEAKRKEVAMLEAELQWFMETERRRIEQGLAESLRSIYRDIELAVRDVAQSRGIDVVLSGDPLPDGIPATPMEARQQILFQKVVYWTPQVDLTDDVILQLNAKYQPQGAALPIRPDGQAQTELASADQSRVAMPISNEGR